MEGKNSPWGKIETSREVYPGIYSVVTSGHGGYLVLKNANLPDKHMSLIKRFCTSKTKDWYSFEEDLDYLILAVLNRDYIGGANFSESTITRALSRYYPEFLNAADMELDEKAYSEYLAIKENRRRREAKDPNLIISAMRYNYQDRKTVMVTTADGEKYLIDDSYSSSNKELSAYEIILKIGNLIVGSYNVYPRYLTGYLYEELESRIEKHLPEEMHNEIKSKLKEEYSLYFSFHSDNEFNMSVKLHQSEGKEFSLGVIENGSSMYTELGEMLAG